jgi:hypothetical protein
MRSITQLRRVDGGFGMAERMIVGRALRQRRQIGRIGDRQFGDGFVEIGKRRAGDAVGIQTEEDLVEIEFEDLVLAVGLLDAEGEDCFLGLALHRLLARQEEVLGDLLGDRRAALASATEIR